MYKSKLQEFSQSKSWELPLYTTTKEGFDHCPQFKASVVVNGATYFTPDFCKSSKEAQNLVAKLAFEQLTGISSASPSSPMTASSRSFQPSGGNDNVQVTSMVRMNPQISDDNQQKGQLSASPASVVAAPSRSYQQGEAHETVQVPSTIRMNLPVIDDRKHQDMARMCKNQLQIYAQKRNLNLPVYISEREGPPHAPRFRSKVIVNDKTYGSQEYYGTIKDAENAAAKVALTSICPDGIEEEDPGFFKNLLQELAQKDYSCLPEYETISSGPSHSPIFISTVEIKEESFTGQEAKTKKLAEVYAAKVAYSALKERKLKQNSESETPGQYADGKPPCFSSKLQSIAAGELPLGTGETSAEHAVLSKDMSANEKHSESKHVEGQLEGSLSIDHMIQSTLESVFPTQSPSGPSLGVNNETWASTHASSPQKKVKVFPQVQNMTLPPGVKIVHQDENWVAATMDSIHGNA